MKGLAVPRAIAMYKLVIPCFKALNVYIQEMLGMNGFMNKVAYIWPFPW